MLATVIEQPGRAVRQELDDPRPEPGEALVRVLAVGLCGSDAHAMKGSQPLFVYPQIPGHEVCGEVVEVHPTEGDPSVQIGDRVVLDPAIKCGHCYACRIGRGNCCVRMRVLGVHTAGGCAELVKAPLSNLHRAPQGMTPAEAAMAEPFSIGMQANGRGRVTKHDTVAIIGGGPIGLAVLMVAVGRGAKCAVIEPVALRRQAAEALGAAATFDPAESAASEAVREWTAGEGANVVIEAVGSPQTYREAVEMASAAGRVVFLGLPSQDVALPAVLLIKKELDLLGSRLNVGTFPEVLRLMKAGILQPRRLISQEMPLAQAPEALALAAEARPEVLKIVLVADKSPTEASAVPLDGTSTGCS